MIVRCKILFALIFIPMFLLKAQWISQNSNSQETLLDVSFINEFEGWTVGFYGIVLHTSDGGESWSRIYSDSIKTFSSVQFHDSNLGWIASHSGDIYRTMNGGISWTKTYENSGLRLTSMNFLNANIGYAAGQKSGKSYILKTIDGGLNWQVSFLRNSSFSITEIFVLDEYKCFVSINDELFRTTDGGQSWEQKTSSGIIRGIDFVNDSVGYAVAETYFMLIYKTIDAGENWIVIQHSLPFHMYDTKFLDSEHGYIIGTNGKIIVTYDGGNSWTGENSGASLGLNSLAAVDNRHVWAVGQNGTILSRKSSPFIQITYPHGDENLTINNWSTIRWKSWDVDSVNIDLSIDGGASFDRIASSVENYVYFTGEAEYRWRIAGELISDNCLLKISSSDNSEIYDVSDLVFAISPVSANTLNTSLMGFLDAEGVIRGDIYGIFHSLQAELKVFILLTFPTRIIHY